MFSWYKLSGYSGKYFYYELCYCYLLVVILLFTFSLFLFLSRYFTKLEPNKTKPLKLIDSAENLCVCTSCYFLFEFSCKFPVNRFSRSVYVSLELISFGDEKWEKSLKNFKLHCNVNKMVCVGRQPIDIVCRWSNEFFTRFHWQGKIRRRQVSRKRRFKWILREKCEYVCVCVYAIRWMGICFCLYAYLCVVSFGSAAR